MATTKEDAKLRADAERLADIITVLQRSFMMRLSKDLNRGNVTFAQYFLLGFLTNQGQLTMTEIASRMGHTTAAATGLVDRLESLGMVKRAHAKDDRRKIIVSPTSQGEAIVAKVREDMVANLLQVMQVLESDEQKSWLRIYQKIHDFCQNQ